MGRRYPTRDGHREPLAIHTVIAKFDHKVGSRTGYIEKPMPGFRVKMHLGHDWAGSLLAVNAQNQVSIAGERIKVPLLCRRQIPGSVKAVRISGQEKHPARAIGFGKVTRSRGGLLRRWAWSDGVLWPRPCDCGWCRFVPFQEDRWNG